MALSSAKRDVLRNDTNKHAEVGAFTEVSQSPDHASILNARSYSCAQTTLLYSTVRPDTASDHTYLDGLEATMRLGPPPGE